VKSYPLLVLCGLVLASCATVQPAPSVVRTPASQAASAIVSLPVVPTLKRKIAVARFSNSTNYGRALLLPGESDNLANQAADMLTARLTDSGKFLVFERSDLYAVQSERDLSRQMTPDLVGVDALIVGSVTEFGRRIEGQAGFLSSTKRQTASATVEIRVVDVTTGQAFFSTSGSGTASVEAGEVAGFGSRAGYDSTLNDKAISAAISDLINNVVQKLQERRWHTDILDVGDGIVRISGGPTQGLKIGDQLRVERQGRTVTSQQSGLPIILPGEEIAQIQVVSFFGEGTTEGATARVTRGVIARDQTQSLTVTEMP
jgi:curli biogenesis system outer membrane secretion channel CsgG